MKLSLTRTQAMVLLEIEFPLLADFAIEQEQMFKGWFAKYIETEKPLVNEDEDETTKAYIEAVMAEGQLREEHYPQYIRRSTFLVAYGALEQGLHQLAKAAFSDQLATAEPVQRNFFLKEAKNFFKKFAGVDFGVFTSDWDSLNKYRLVRNAVAHNGGRLDPNDDRYLELLEFIDKRGDIEVDQFDRLFLSDKWCSGFLDLSRRVLTALVDQLAF